MSVTNETYDPSETIPGYTITLGDILSMDCWNGMPAVIVKSDETRDPRTEAEYEEHGRYVPVLHDIEIGCEQYQRIARLPLSVEIQSCEGCPLNSSDH